MPAPTSLPILALWAALPAVSASAPAPMKLGTRDGRDVVLFPGPVPRIRQVLPAVVVQVAPGAAVPERLRKEGEHLGGPSWRVPAADPLASAAAWRAVPGVRAADPDMVLGRRRAAALDFDDPGYGGQWYLERLGMEALFAVSLGSPDVRVAVIDSGVDIAHPDLAPAVLAPRDVVDNDDDPTPPRGEFCPDGVMDICDEHGTAVAGIVGARGGNAVGIVGLCPLCTLVPIRLIAEDGAPLSADVRAFEHAIAQDVAVINNSWGYIEPTPAPDTLADAIHRASTEPRGGLGALVVFAAGNDDRALGDDEVEALPDVLCVSAADSYGRPTAYTNRGACVDVAAPSATVSIVPGGGVTHTFGGTSAAAPVVAGLAAWALSADPTLSAAQLAELLVGTAVQSPLITPDAEGHHDVFGFGMVSARAILAQVSPDAAVPDAALPDAALPDAGAPDALPDAPVADAATGEPPDAATGEPPDATVNPESDGGAAAGSGGASGGCAHTSARTPAPWALLLGLGGALVILRKRKRAASCGRAAWRVGGCCPP